MLGQEDSFLKDGYVKQRSDIITYVKPYFDGHVSITEYSRDGEIWQIKKDYGTWKNKCVYVGFIRNQKEWETVKRLTFLK
jgi:hypothetical protein